MAVKMPLINVGQQISADVCKDNGSGPMRTVKGRGGQNGTFCGHYLRMNPKAQFKPQKR